MDLQKSILGGRRKVKDGPLIRLGARRPVLSIGKIWECIGNLWTYNGLNFFFPPIYWNKTLGPGKKSFLIYIFSVLRRTFGMKIGKFSSLQLWSPASSTVTTGGMCCLPYLGEVWLILAGLCLHHWTFPAFVLSQLKLISSHFYTFCPTFLYQADT